LFQTNFQHLLTNELNYIIVDFSKFKEDFLVDMQVRSLVVCLAYAYLAPKIRLGMLLNVMLIKNMYWLFGFPAFKSEHYN